ncbi:MAG TPA: MFS transporter [Acidimicrobiales bacterium]|nr:MFS transporter [Acidimicrobiales bacterium]
MRRLAETQETDAAEDHFAPLYLGAFIAYGDRFLIGPILVGIAADFDVSLGAAAAVATLYLFLYGVLQPVYGFLSDRWGRVRVMRAALGGVVVANAFAAFAPSLGALVVARGAAAAFVAALLPTSLVYVGDRVPFARRQQVIANVLAAGALGTVGATIGAGVLDRYVSWRVVFAVPAVLALLDAIALGRLPESLPAEAGGGPLTQIRRVLAHPWAVFLVLLALAEGAAMLGFLTFLAPALQVHGVSSAQAGLVVAVYGAAVFGGLQLVKRVLRRARIPAPAMIAIGGAILFVAFLVAAAAQGIPNILVASLLIGVGYSFMHSTLQTWATEVAPEARGTATSLFVTAVFTGASIAHTQISPLAGDHRFAALFLVGAAVTVPVAVVASLSRARFARSS